jgi:hypothetical protein
MISVKGNFVSVMFQCLNHTATHACQLVEALQRKPMATKNTWANPGVIAVVRGSTATAQILQDNAPIRRAACIFGVAGFQAFRKGLRDRWKTGQEN